MKWINTRHHKLQDIMPSEHVNSHRVEKPEGAKSSRHRNSITWSSIAALVLLGAGGLFFLRAQDTGENAAFYQQHPAELLSGFRHAEVASVSDAEEQLGIGRMYMSHRMQSLFPTKFAGYAVTVKLVKQENHDPDALTGMLEAIDSGEKDSVYVMTIEDGENIAGMGGLMGTAMSARNFAGAIIDGGVRDVAYLHKIGFPVYATGIVPSTSVGHYKFGGKNQQVTCDGVPVAAGDIIAADQDGVVVVPRSKASEVLVKAQQLDFQEHSMYAWIEKLKSISAAVKQFGRL